MSIIAAWWGLLLPALRCCFAGGRGSSSAGASGSANACATRLCDREARLCDRGAKLRGEEAPESDSLCSDAEWSSSAIGVECGVFRQAAASYGIGSATGTVVPSIGAALLSGCSKSSCCALSVAGSMSVSGEADIVAFVTSVCSRQAACLLAAEVEVQLCSDSLASSTRTRLGRDSCIILSTWTLPSIRLGLLWKQLLLLVLNTDEHSCLSDS